MNFIESESKISEIKTQYWLLNSLIDNALKGVDENLARLLQDSIYKLIPLPEPGRFKIIENLEINI